MPGRYPRPLHKEPEVPSEPQQGGNSAIVAREGMSMKFAKFTLLLLVLALVPAAASSASHSSGRSTSSHTRTSGSHHSRRGASSGIKRDKHGRIKRSSAAKHAFERQHPCPSTGKTSGRCPGYVVDHVKALECDGVDAPSNMQWQTIAEGKAKDRTEGRCQ
jgi:hypothetical protein